MIGADLLAKWHEASAAMEGLRYMRNGCCHRLPPPPSPPPGPIFRDMLTYLHSEAHEAVVAIWLTMRPIPPGSQVTLEELEMNMPVYLY